MLAALPLSTLPALVRSPLPLPARPLLRRSLALFLPIGAVITVVLLPMVALYEHTRRDALQARVSGLVAAGSAQVSALLAEIDDDIAVTAIGLERQPAVPSPLALAERLRDPLLAYPRYRLMEVVDARGRSLARAVDRPLPRLDPVLRAALPQALRLRQAQLWFSPVLWPSEGSPSLLIARPLFTAAGQRSGALFSVVSLQPLAGGFNNGVNDQPNLAQGFLLSAEGRAINALPDAGPGLEFAARFPTVWQRLQRQDRGMVETAEGLFVFQRGPAPLHLAVVVQVPAQVLRSGSLFAQPTGVALLLLLYGGAAAASVGLARSRLHLEALREQERRLHERMDLVQRTAGVGMCLCDPQTGRFISVNRPLCEFFQRGEADLLACTWQQLTHPQDLARDQLQVEQLIRGDFDHYRLRKRFLRPDGSSVWGDLVVACTRHADGTVQDLIGQINDVSDLIAKTESIEAAASAGVVGVWDWDVVNDVLTWDAVMYGLYGLRQGEFLGTREAWERGVHPEDRPFVDQEMEAALRGWREYQPRFRVVWPDGSIHHVQARSRTTYGPDGSPLRMIGVNYDITEQVERELEVEGQRRLLATTLDALVDPLLFLTVVGPRPGYGPEPPSLRISELNPAAAAFLQRSRSQLVGQPLALVLPAALNAELHDALLAVARGGPPLLADEYPVQLGEGAPTRHLDVRAASVPDGLVLNVRDVSERRKALSDLTASEERFRLLAENVTDVVFLCEAGRITWISPGVLPMLGWHGVRCVGHAVVAGCHPEDRALARDVVERVEAGEQALCRVRVPDSEGRWHWIEVHAGPYRTAAGQQRGAVAAFRIVDEEVEAEVRLARRARTDPLTGLLNRQEILERLERLIESSRHPAQRHGDGSLAVLFCDIDHFKDINDRHGHGGGDAVLRSLAERLRLGTRREDLVGRIGGDELLVVLQGMPSLQAAESIGQKLLCAARQPLRLPDGELLPTLSIGVTLIRPEEHTDEVVGRADAAMYEAKKGGRNRVIAFT